MAWNAANNSHSLRISATGTALTFEFDKGWNVGGDWKTVFNERAEAIACAALREAGVGGVQQVVYVSVQPVQAQHVVQHTVERQVLVARCRYCQQLSAIDLAACSNCGGRNFA